MQQNALCFIKLNMKWLGLGEIYLTSAITMSWVFLMYWPSVFTTVWRNLIYWTCLPWVSIQCTKCCITLSVISLASCSLSWNMAVHVWVSNNWRKKYRHKGNSNYNKTCLKRPLKIDKTKILMTNGNLMKVESIAECSLEHSAILMTCIKW